MNSEDRRQQMITAALIACGVFLCFLPAILPYFVATLGLFGHAVLWFLDCVMGVSVFGLPPWVSWGIIGTLLGAALGLWTVLPALGHRRARVGVAVIPFACLTVLMVASAFESLRQAAMNPPPSPLPPEPATPRDIRITIP